MKISLSWLLDHLSLSLKDVHIKELVEQIGATTAEIDAVEEIQTDLLTFFIARIEIINTQCEVYIVETGKKVSLPLRKDLAQGGFYLVKKEGALVKWASLAECGSKKDGLFPQLHISDEQALGSWRNDVESHDVIITIDNKAITNRPDLWGHRGCAREAAALLGKKLIDEDRIFASKTISHFPKEAFKKDGQSFEFRINEQNQVCGTPCRRFAGLVISKIDNTPSLPWMAFRLARVDSRAHNAVVDLTNYVMFDIGQPMHAFDAEKLSSQIIEVRCAQQGESLLLLDGVTALFDGSECVVTDGTHPVSLAGIMGGENTSVTSSTRSLVIESANFDPTSIRITAARLKKRTESSSRFEKSLDPNQNTLALLRFLKLLDETSIAYHAEESIVSLGPLISEKTVIVEQRKIELMIGMTITQEKVYSILTHLGFGVVKKDDEYVVTVPTFRATKDISLPEDIVEEIARFIGYKNIIPVLPKRKIAVFDTQTIERKRCVKQFLAYGCSMQEVQTYAVFEESFLSRLGIDPQAALFIKNPLSEQWQRLITSLIPNLIRCVVSNETEQEELKFFEISRVWFMQDSPIESQECAGIWYERKKNVDFYEGKEIVQKVFATVGIQVQWQKPEKGLPVWYDSNQSAELWYADRIVGRAGKVAKKFLGRVLEGDAFIFEIDANFLLHVVPDTKTHILASKYPSTEQDISLLVPLSLTVGALESAISKADSRINKVVLIDSFENPKWPGKKSLSFRISALSQTETLSKPDIETLFQHIISTVKSLGAEIR